MNTLSSGGKKFILMWGYFFIALREQARKNETLVAYLVTHASTRDQTHTLGMCPDQEWNLQPFGLWDNTATIWAAPARARVLNTLKVCGVLKPKSMRIMKNDRIPWVYPSGQAGSSEKPQSQREWGTRKHDNGHWTNSRDSKEKAGTENGAPVFPRTLCFCTRKLCKRLQYPWKRSLKTIIIDNSPLSFAYQVKSCLTNSYKKYSEEKFYQPEYNERRTGLLLV